MTSSSRLETALAAIDAANEQDPNVELVDGEEVKNEIAYSRRMTTWLRKIAPDAPEFMQIAARAQHIRRWEIPRTDYPEGKKGYHLWRTTLYRHHANAAVEIMATSGYCEDDIEKTRRLLLKKNLRTDSDMQLLEDVICLVFLENYFVDFSKQHGEEKMIGIIQKTWDKMTERGHEAALALPIADEVRALLERALR